MLRRLKDIRVLPLLLLLLSGCTVAEPVVPLAAEFPQAAPTAAQAPVVATSTPLAETQTPQEIVRVIYIEDAPGSPTDAPASTPTPDSRLTAKYWAEWPLIPEVSSRAKAIYQQGIASGNDPRAFSTIGDCQSEPAVFMGTYDTETYLLGQGYEHLTETIEQFRGSFDRDSVTVRDGLSVASVLSPMWADPERCIEKETPLACEIRIHKPSIMFINLGTNWKGGNEVTHEEYLRKIVDELVAHGVVPVISSKGDNQEGDHRINQSMARVAYDYDVPFWNFWRSIRDLPGKGIDGTREGGYLTTEAWGRRSFTGLQALDAVWRELSGE